MALIIRLLLICVLSIQLIDSLGLNLNINNPLNQFYDQQAMIKEAINQANIAIYGCKNNDQCYRSHVPALFFCEQGKCIEKGRSGQGCNVNDDCYDKRCHAQKKVCIAGCVTHGGIDSCNDKDQFCDDLEKKIISEFGNLGTCQFKRVYGRCDDDRYCSSGKCGTITKSDTIPTYYIKRCIPDHSPIDHNFINPDIPKDSFNYGICRNRDSYNNQDNTFSKLCDYNEVCYKFGDNNAWYCKHLRFHGEGCKTNELCRAGLCDTSTGACPDTCLSDLECRIFEYCNQTNSSNGINIKGKCTKKASIGQSCSEDKHCFNELCDITANLCIANPDDYINEVVVRRYESDLSFAPGYGGTNGGTPGTATTPKYDNSFDQDVEYAYEVKKARENGWGGEAGDPWAKSFLKINYTNN